MLSSFPFSVLVGSILGFLAGLGIGGGSLLILWLTMVLSMEQAIARSVNLLFFLPSAIAASIFRWKQGRICFPVILPAAVCGCIMAAVFSWLSMRLDLAFLKKGFGILLLVTGVRELLYKTKKERDG